MKKYLILASIALIAVVVAVLIYHRTSSQSKRDALPANTDDSTQSALPPLKAPSPDVQVLQDRFLQVVSALVEQSNKNGQVDRDAMWNAICRWLDQQEDVSAQIRLEFRRSLRVELGMAPEQ